MNDLGVCLDDGWSKQAHLDGFDWIPGLGEAADWLHIE